MSRMPVRVALHAHSRWSYDADWPLARIARTFGRLGAAAVLMSEHDTGFEGERFSEYLDECRAAGTARCALVPGIEYSCPDNDVHILVWGLDRFLGASRPVLDTLRDVAEQGGIAVLAHPVRRAAWRLYSPDWRPYLAGIEIWNRKADGLAPGGDALDLVRGSGLAATTGVDFHRAQQLWPLMNEIVVDAALPLEAGLIEGIRAGRVEPCAFGARLLGVRDREPVRAVAAHQSLERARRALKRALARARGGLPDTDSV